MADSTRITVKVKPRSSVEIIEGWQDDVLVVRLTAPPVEGAANSALVKLIARKLGIAKSRVTIVTGESSRRKVLEIEDLGLDAVMGGLEP